MSRRPLAAAALLVVAAGVGYHLLASERPRPEGAEPIALPTWEMIGCWEVRTTSWTATPEARSRPRGGVREGSRPPDGSGAPSPGPAPPTLDPPRSVMLLPDSVDPWGRVLDSYRAVDRRAGEAARSSADPEARPSRTLRWFTGRDTLWLVWREGGARAGIALTPHEDRFRGTARALADSADLSAGAEAWRVNCATGAPTSSPPRRRR